MNCIFDFESKLFNFTLNDYSEKDQINFNLKIKILVFIKTSVGNCKINVFL